MFAIEVQSRFSAAHALRLPDGSTEPLHGHDFQVTVKIAADKLDDIGTVIDFHLIEQCLEDIVQPWRNRNLNEIAPFNKYTNPSAERIAEHIGYDINTGLKTFAFKNMAQLSAERNVRLVEVRITEAPGCLAIWIPTP
jgi:6-pyruvoyltetrahydropterin/6-carboxytetrahydropterin synthase